MISEKRAQLAAKMFMGAWSAPRADRYVHSHLYLRCAMKGGELYDGQFWKLEDAEMEEEEEEIDA
jgi:hypothetical protein